MLYSRSLLGNLSVCIGTNFFYFIIIIIFILRTALAAYEVPRLGVRSELQLLAYTTATTTLDLSGTCDLHRSSQAMLDP